MYTVTLNIYGKDEYSNLEKRETGKKLEDISLKNDTKNIILKTLRQFNKKLDEQIICTELQIEKNGEYVDSDTFWFKVDPKMTTLEMI